MLGCRYFDINHNDAFSAMKVDGHRHFLRIRVLGDEATVYPIKLAAVPCRDQWREVARAADPLASVFIADPPLAPQMLEDPIVLQVRAAASTGDVKAPGAISPET